MKLNETITLNFRGGIISPGYLYNVLAIAEAAQVVNVRFGSRQQLIFDVPIKCMEAFTEACSQNKIKIFTAAADGQNIVSSYSSTDIFVSETWLSQGVYKDIFDLFDYTPKLKVNICAADQTFVPFFTGNINWIASAKNHFWYLYIRLPKTTSLYRFPILIYTNDIVNVSRSIERLIAEKTAMFYEDIAVYGNFLYQVIQNSVKPISKPVVEALVLPAFHLPYYEGFNKNGAAYWLGIYRRNELFAVAFLKEICKLCLDTRIGELYATTWKSIIVKGINADRRNLWDYLLGKYRINVRHAANELNWQVEDNNEDGLVIKRHIIRYFDKEDVRTYGLCFAVKMQFTSGIFGSVIVRRQQQKITGRLKSQERFELLYTDQFNPNSSAYILYRDNVEKENLGTYLASLCKMFYEFKSTVNPISQRLPDVQPAVAIQKTRLLHQCKHCLTVYDEQAGDAENNVAAGTLFCEVGEDYRCPICEAPKTDFKKIEVKSATLNV